ncbi:MAG: hypothetical protein ACNA8P_06085 [Phycisphaerales bacterium]
MDEVTFGVGDARAEDSFGEPVVRPYQETHRLHRHEIRREPSDPDPVAPPSPEGDD